MSDQASTAFVKNFTDSITLEPQQEEARLFTRGMQKMVAPGEQAFFERIGLVSASKQEIQHGPTRQQHTPHTRREVKCFTFDHSDLIDRNDLRRMEISPQASYVKTFRNAFNRAKDDEFILAATGTAFEGKAGTTAVLWTIAAGRNVVGDGAATNMGIDKVMEANQLLDEGEIPVGNRYLAAAAEQRRDILTETIIAGSTPFSAAQYAPVASADFGDARALVVGTVTFYGGFEWIRSERLQLDRETGEGRSCLAWHRDGMGTATLSDIFVDIGPRRDRQVSTQVYMEMDIGVSRVNEASMVEIFCTEA